MSYECRFRCGCTNVRPGSSPRELSLCPQPFQEHFMKAWQASERHDYDSLKHSISEMKAAASTKGDLEPLDVFRVLEWSESVYAMTLVAFCAVHGRKEMVQLLLEEGANIGAGCHKCGAPVSQMMVHCLVQNVKVDTSMVQYLIEKNSPLSREIDLELDGPYARHGSSWSLLDLSLTMTIENGFEVVKVLVESGKVDPITGGSPGGEAFRIFPIFQEYWFHDTNYYIRWLCKKQMPIQERRKFVYRVLKCITAMRSNVYFTSWIDKQRTPSHAILTSQHWETTALLVQKGKEQGENFLTETNSTGKTALHMAAESGDLKSVKILLQLEADVTACDRSNWNPFMLALDKGHMSVAKFMLENSKDTEAGRLDHVRKTIEWAIDKNITTFFQLLREVTPGILLTPLTDAGDNTIVHLVAAAGNTEMFEVILEKLWSKNDIMEKVLQFRNKERKTALQLAVERECIDILKAVEKRVDMPGDSIRLSVLRDKWRREVPQLFCHASSCGSLTAVKHFIAMSSDAAKLKLPLLRASANGHTKCVTLLLEKKASVRGTDVTGKNCLMLAIQNHHKQTALAILSDEEQGLDALKCIVKEKGEEISPLRLLIKEMPELAEYVLNRGITNHDESGKLVVYDFQLLDYEGGSEDNEALHSIISSPRHNKAKVRHKTEDPNLVTLFDDSLEEGATDIQHQVKNDVGQDDKPKYISKLTLLWMIDYKRLELLQHPLVENYFFHTFWLVTFPVFLGYLLLYCVFLILLTSFALVSPRPGPDSETCPDGNPNITTNGTDCTGQSGVERGFLAGAAGLILFLCCFLLFMELIQLYRERSKYFTDLDNCFQLTLLFVTIIFVAPGFTNDCWCAHNWQWQIGALALCLGWVNLIILLRFIPWTAIPIIVFIIICKRFLQVLLLLFLLFMAFALPFYMVFVRIASASEGMGVSALVSFTSPAHAVVKTMVQTVGEIDFENIFNEGDLLYNPMTYILFVIFVIIMPVLFINLLIGLAVGDTKETIEKAERAKIEAQVNFIRKQQNFESQRSIKHCFTIFLAQLFRWEHKRPLRIANFEQMEERNRAIFSEVMGISDSDAVKAALQQESENIILQLKEEMKALTEKESENILQLKEEIKAMTKKGTSDNDAVKEEIKALTKKGQRQSEEVLQVLKALTEKVEALGEDGNTRTSI